MKGEIEDYWWMGAVALAPIYLPIIFGLVFPEIPLSPCVENITMECDEWSPECNINMTVKEVSGPYYDEKTKYVETYNREVCLEWENGTRVMPG